MVTQPNIWICFFSPAEHFAYASTVSPRKVIIKSSLGSGRRRCWIELYNDDQAIEYSLGTPVEVRINQTVCFQGQIVEKRFDSIDDYRSLVAEWNPDRQYSRTVNHQFSGMTVTAMLDQLLAGTGLRRVGLFYHPVHFDQITFAGYPIFSAIDLLAKLAGNWYWDLTEEGDIRFRPSNHEPDGYVTLGEDDSTVNLWETAQDQVETVELLAGLEAVSPLESLLVMPERPEPFSDFITRVYARPLASSDALNALQQAILQQMSRPRYEHYIDLLGRGETIQLGDTLRFHADYLPFFPKEQIFRVKAREIDYSHETYRVRLYLTSSFESAPTYFYYLRRDQVIRPHYLWGRVGSFQLDISALDSLAHLDAES